jgi:hypothetical protein
MLALSYTLQYIMLHKGPCFVIGKTQVQISFDAI